MCGFQGTESIRENSGDNGERVPPVPIPNTEVKPFSADGTWLETARESRSLPDPNEKDSAIAGSFYVSLFLRLHGNFNLIQDLCIQCFCFNCMQCQVMYLLRVRMDLAILI